MEKWLLVAGILMAFLVGELNGDYDCFCFFPTSRRRRRLCGTLSDRTIDFCTLYGHVWGIKPVPEYEARRTEQLEKQCVIQYGTGVQLYPDRSASPGALGSVVSISVEVRAGIGLFAGICMLLMALNMLDLLPFLRKIHIPCPKRIQSGSAFWVGLCNGLMPCGPLRPGSW